MSLRIGTRLGPYQIAAAIGAGGMGEVFRATDTRLDRQVAIKVLPEHLRGSAKLRQRFEREAKTISQLQHPGICALFDVGSENGIDFLVMELLQGQTLETRLRDGPLPVEDVLEIGGQIVAAIDAAHRNGVVHRDLKPGNVVLTEAGAKVLDFGLAKELRPALESGSRSPTAEMPLTKEGAIAGTLHYMAPEQVEGKQVDAGADIWAVGCVLYEMTTGRRAFEADSQAGVIAAILGGQAPSASALRASMPKALERLIVRCLQRDPGRRWQSARDLGFALRTSDDEEGPMAPRRVEVGTPKRGPSIVVLPFVDMSPAKDQEYFCDGMAEEVINALAQLEGLRVVARTSAFSFKGRDLDVREIGSELGVRTVLEGSVRKAGDRLRVTTQLIDVGSGYHLWSERFDRQLDDVFAIQDEISAGIVEALKVKLAVATPRAEKRTTNQEAYDLFLRGTQYRWLQDEAGFRKAAECFEKAIALDPDFAAAHAHLGNVLGLMGSFGSIDREVAWEQGRRAALRALELDPSLGKAYTALGLMRAFLKWDFDGAERELKRAMELTPSDAEPHTNLACGYLVPMGRLQEGIAELRRAVEIDPIGLAENQILGAALFFDRQYDEAIQQLQMTVALAPDLFNSRRILSLAYLSNNMPREFLGERRKMLEMSGRQAEIRGLETAFDEGGSEGALRYEIQNELSRVEEASASGTHPNFAIFNLAGCYAQLGEVDPAIRWLEEAVRLHDGWVIMIKVHPWFDNLRSDPRFHDILARMNLA